MERERVSHRSTRFMLGCQHNHRPKPHLLRQARVLTVQPCPHAWSPSGAHERLPEILVVPREKTPTGAAARGNP